METTYIRISERRTFFRNSSANKILDAHENVCRLKPCLEDRLYMKWEEQLSC